MWARTLARPGVRDELRREAVAGLAGREGRAPLHVLLDSLRRMDEPQGDQSVVFDLARLLTAWDARELAQAREQLVEISRTAKLPIGRQVGLVALLSADRQVDTVWQQAQQSVESLRDLVNAMPLLADPALRDTLYTRIEQLLDQLPASLQPQKTLRPC